MGKGKAQVAPGRRDRWRKVFLWVVMWALLLAIGMVGVGCAEYNRRVVDEPGAHLDRDHIRAIIAQESPVYYSDGETRLGVFFEDEHRLYLPWSALPRPYVMAIVAAEDGDFWSHRGVSPKHIARAMFQNLKSGRVVAGGSTLTQQTAKNLYYRPDRSFKSKINELMNALRLEEHYDKTEILTFYVNQFHVSGNGRGLGIAARYFFDKRVEQLTVAECAFLAGLVKAPAYYDPFIGSEERRERSKKKAKTRASYVLQRLIDEDSTKLLWPGDEVEEPLPVREAEVARVKGEAARLLKEGYELKFKRGAFRFDSSVLLDEVGRRLKEPPFDEVFASAGIDDPATAGLKVITTLEADAQREAQYGLWHHLTELGLQLEGGKPGRFVLSGRGPIFEPERPLVTHEFRIGKIVQHHTVKERLELIADVGGRECRIDREAVVRASVEQKRGNEKNRYAKIPGVEIDAWANTIKDGDVVLLSVRESTGDEAICDLELRPTIQGAIVLLQNGEVRAMVGGNDNRNFNRATALRQMGSTWKGPLLHTALELGWKATDLLDNRRAVFPYSTTFYYPNPDHEPTNEVSLAWAGVRSENLASVWLLYHLLDNLSGAEVAGLANKFALNKGSDETDEAYRQRIQKAGVLPTPSRRREALWMASKYEVLSSLEMKPEVRLGLMSLLYGYGYTSEKTKVSGKQRQTLNYNWPDVTVLQPECAREFRTLKKAIVLGVALPSDLSKLFLLMDEDDLIEKVSCGAQPEGFVPVAEATVNLSLVPEDEAGEGGLTGFGRKLKGLFGAKQKVKTKPPLPDYKQTLIYGRVTVEALQAVSSAFERRKLIAEAAEEPVDLYSPEVLYWHPDFRTLLALKTLTSVATRYGVQTELQEVLSIPLGASEVTLEEITLLYGGMTTGEVWAFPGVANAPGKILGTPVPSPVAPTNLISEIRDVDDNILYRAKPRSESVASIELTSVTSDILNNVVNHGTGQRAKNAIEKGGAIVPLGGKTGTTNQFRNAAFVGFIPRAGGSDYNVGGGYTLGVYVGYDDNRMMSHGNLRVSGSQGALPSWILTAQGLSSTGLVGVPALETELDVWPLNAPASLVEVEVETESGMRIAPTKSEDLNEAGDNEPVAGATILTRTD